MPTKRKRYFGSVIEPRAGVVLLSDFVNLFSLAREIGGSLKTKIHIICGIWWSIESPKQILKVIFIVYRTRLLYPKIAFSFLANTPGEHRLLRLLGVRSVFCPQNCFIDEQVYTIKPGSEKKYNAVYNAVLSAFKRQILAKDIEKLALITYRFENTDYKAYLDEHLADPIWLNYQYGDEPVFMSNDQLAEAYNASYAGLALSAVEGAMYASGEYLLCGIPVVTTASKGGRDIYFSSYNSVLVEDSAAAVAAAVRKLRETQKDPHIIREKTLELMKRDRAVFIDHVNSIIRAKGLNYDIADTWDKWFVNKLRRELYADELVGLLNASVGPKPSF